MSSRQLDTLIMRDLAETRRKQRAELKAYRLRVAAQHIADGYDSTAIGRRLCISTGYAAELMAEVKRGGSHGRGS